MEKLIACCGLNCAGCEARVATLSNDDVLRAQVAEKWRTAYNAGITAEMINCTGCREAGIKFSHCEVCEIRGCAKSKGFETCADCGELENCQTVGKIHQYVPEALENLRSLN